MASCVKATHSKLGPPPPLPTLNFNTANLHSKEHTFITNKSVLRKNTAASTAHIHHTPHHTMLPYCHLWPVQYLSILSHKWNDSPKTLSNTKLVFCFPLQISSETFHILGINKRDMIRNVEGSLWKVAVNLVRFQWNLDFLNGFWKCSQIKFHKNSSSGSRVAPCGQTDWQTWRK